MKTPSTLLFDLLKSLSGAELRYVKVQIGNVDKGYVKLMTAILTQNSYDEEALKRENATESFVKNLSVSKRYLLDLILTMLSRFTQSEQSEQILKQLRFAKILFQKNFLTAAGKELDKAKAAALQLDAYEELLLVYSLEKQLLTAETYELSQVQRLHESIGEALQKIQNINDYWLFYTRLYQLQLQKQSSPEAMLEAERLIQSPFFQQEAHATTVRSQMYCHQARASYYFSSRQPEKAQEANRSFLKLLEENVHYRKRFSEAYFSTLNNFLIDSLMLQKFEALDEGLVKLNDAKDDPAFTKIKNLPSRIFRQTMMLQFNRAMSTQQYAPAIALLPRLATGLEAFKKEIEPQHEIALQYLTAYLLFKSKNYQETITWTNALLQSPHESILSEYFHYTRWLNILAHFELQNDQLVASLLQQVRRYIQQSRKLMKTETLLLKTMKKALGMPDRKSMVMEIKKMVEPLGELKKEERRFFQYLDLAEWANGYGISAR